MDSLKQLGKIKPLEGLKSLELKKRYRVLNVLRCQTKYGPRVLIELEKTKVFLPVRFNVNDEDTVTTLSTCEIEVVQPVGTSFELEFYPVQGDAANIEELVTQLLLLRLDIHLMDS